MSECQITDMKKRGIIIEELPALNRPILIAGFDGWGNVLDISTGMVTYIVQKLNARAFAKIDSDNFYQYDANRPLVNIISGTMESFTPPGGTFYAARTDSGSNDLVLLRADEPDLCWHEFADELFSLSKSLDVDTIITLGSMYDNVLHTDRIISGIASTTDLLIRLKQKNVVPVSYHGPSAIHSLIQAEGEKRGYPCISLWCHCPYYLQNTTHFGLLSHLSSILSSVGQFELDPEDLDASWKELQQQIEALIANSNEFKAIIDEIRKEKVKGSWESLKKSTKGEKVVDLTDFLRFK